MTRRSKGAINEELRWVANNLSELIAIYYKFFLHLKIRYRIETIAKLNRVRMVEAISAEFVRALKRQADNGGSSNAASVSISWLSDSMVSII